jgi:hypothetical protein
VIDLDAAVANIRRQRRAGELVGRKWAEEQASIRDMERIWHASGEGGCGMYALCAALNMDESEVQVTCFGGEAYSLCFAEGFTRGVNNYFEECDDGTFFDE